MLSITGLHNFYFLPHFHDMRCKALKFLQSDGYNVYMYLDDEMVDIEHICCLAHVHNKLQEAKKLGYKIVDFFLAETWSGWYTPHGHNKIS